MERRPVLYPGQHRRLALTPDDIRERVATSVPGRRTAPTRPPSETEPLVAAAGSHSAIPDLPSGSRGDHDLNPDFKPRLPLRSAAVLIGIVEERDGPTILLTRRTDHLTEHAGEVSFPGGRIDPGDDHAEAAALREAREEIGLAATHATLIGRLDTYVTGTGFEVVPVVALLRPPLALRPDPHEVAEIFGLPLGELLRPGALYMQSGIFDGIEHWYYALDWQGRHVWGATAGMLNNLVELLAGE
jgi:8-oxo-dGTP pyrophosphatase MutT (NUDIX family)